MSTLLTPAVLKFEAEEQAASYGYDSWLHAKVQASRNDPRPSIPHDQAMTQVREKLNRKLAD